MTARLRHHHVLLLGLGSLALAMAACAAPEVSHAVSDTKETTQASTVVVEMKDASGTSLGTCSGTLTSSKTVLTAGHCIAGVKSWSVTSGSKTVSGSVGSTSWTTFGSDLSHPEHSDVGVIALDSEIKLASYPAIATSMAADGTKGVQFFRSSASAKDFSSATVTIQGGASKGFRLNYLIDTSATFVDPGAAVLDANNNIIGVVSGKGKTSGMLHVARVENYRTWAKTAATCAASLATRDWGSGNTDTGGAGYGGTPSTTVNTGGWGGTGGGWGSSSGGYGGGDGSGNGGTGINVGSTVPGYGMSTGTGSTTSSGGTTSGGTTSGGSSSGGTDTTNINKGDGSNTCPGAPVCEGSDCGAGGSGLNGGTGSTSPGGGSSTSTGGSSTSVKNPDGSTTTTTTNPNGTTTVTTVTPNGSGGASTVSQTKNPDGSTTTTVTTPGGSTTTTTVDANGNPIANPTGSGSTTPSTGTGEGCSGSTDNSETCPTSADSATCASATCGACAAGRTCADVNIDYGSCGPGACSTVSVQAVK